MLNLIVAVADNGVIGREGDLPWRLSADLQRFKRLTMGAPLVMGRKTWESIGRPLPGRISIVVTRQADYDPGFSEVRVVGTPEQGWQLAHTLAGNNGEVFVIGGEALYRAALPHADRIYLTRVHATLPGDAFFPELVMAEWECVQQESLPVDARNEYPATWQCLERAEWGEARGLEGCPS